MCGGRLGTGQCEHMAAESSQYTGDVVAAASAQPPGERIAPAKTPPPIWRRGRLEEPQEAKIATGLSPPGFT